MKIAYTTNNPVLVSSITAALKAEGIDHFVADQNISLTEGSIGVFQQRIMVLDDDLEEARDISNRLERALIP